MTQAIRNPFPLFLDRGGRPLTGGKVYIGVAGQDPELSPVATYFDSGQAIVAEQPINVIGGMTVRGGNPTQVFVEAEAYSIRVRDADGAEVFYTANAILDVEQYQPLDSDLTAIAALTTTSFGRSLLTMASAEAARAALGVVTPLPLSGGTVTGEIKRNGAGAYPYMADGAYTVARILVTANGAPDPRTQPGDIWFEASA